MRRIALVAAALTGRDAEPAAQRTCPRADLLAQPVERRRCGIRTLAGESVDDALRCERTVHRGAVSLPRLRPGIEIGRASCQDIVCQSVSISLVAVSFKKKKL